jgi:hypothetical protein
VGGHAEADEGKIGPVFRVVARLEAGAGEVGDLVALEAESRERLHRAPVEIGHEVVVGQIERSGPRAVREKGAALHLQYVEAQVLRREGRDPVEAALPARGRLARPAENEVHGQVGEPGRPRALHRANGIGARVQAAHLREHAVVERLHAEADPGRPRVPQLPVAGGVEVGGVRLHRDLGPDRQAEAAAREIDDLREARPRPQGRRAPAEVQRVGGRRGSGLHLRAQGAKVALLPRVVGPARVDREVAVGALRLAEGNVDVEAEPRGVCGHASS